MPDRERSGSDLPCAIARRLEALRTRRGLLALDFDGTLARSTWSGSARGSRRSWSNRSPRPIHDVTVLSGTYELRVGLYFVSDDDQAELDLAIDLASMALDRLP